MSTTVQAPPEDCLDERYWSYFLASSLITFFAGLILILSFRLAAHFCQCSAGGKGRDGAPVVRQGDEGGSTHPSTVIKVDLMTRLKWQCEALISGQTAVGRIMVSSPHHLNPGISLVTEPSSKAFKDRERSWQDHQLPIYIGSFPGICPIFHGCLFYLSGERPPSQLCFKSCILSFSGVPLLHAQHWIPHHLLDRCLSVSEPSV